MRFKLLAIFDIFLFVAIVLLDLLAFKYHLYWRWRWCDKPMHFLGGWCLGLAGVIISEWKNRANDFANLSFRKILLVSIIPALLVGSFWEALEFNSDKFHFMDVVWKSLPTFEHSWQESMADLSFDLLGAVFNSLLFILPKKWKQKQI